MQTEENCPGVDLRTSILTTQPKGIPTHIQNGDLNQKTIWGATIKLSGINTVFSGFSQ